MARGASPLARWGAVSCGAYAALFLLMHVPVREGALGILARQPAGYLAAARSWNPLLRALEGAGDLQPALVAAGWVAIYAVLLGAYAAALRAARRARPGEIGPGAVLAWAALGAIPLLALPHLLSRDLYAYLFYGRMDLLHGVNPLTVAPVDVVADPYLVYLKTWKHSPSPYGPLWALLSRGVTALLPAGDGFLWSYLLSYKLLALACHLGAAALVWNLLGRLAPERRAWGTLLYAWNPLVLIETAGNGHNDALIVLLLLLAVLLAATERPAASAAAVAAAACVKWFLGVLVPFAVLAAALAAPGRAARLRGGARAAAAALLVAAALYAPYWDGGAAVRTIVDAPSSSGAVNSLAALGAEVYAAARTGVPLEPDRLERARLPDETRETLTRHRRAGVAAAAVAAKALFAAAWIAGLAALARRPTLAGLVRSCFWVLLAGLLLTPWFWPWYLAWPLGLAALLPPGAEAATATLFAALAPLVELKLPYDWWALRPLAVFVPVAVVALVRLARRPAAGGGAPPRLR